jgi:hypothetical protein
MIEVMQQFGCVQQRSGGICFGVGSNGKWMSFR